MFSFTLQQSTLHILSNNMLNYHKTYVTDAPEEIEKLPAQVVISED